MSSEWPNISLGECCCSIEDGDWIETRDQGEAGYRLLQISNIGLGRFRENGSFRWVTPETFRRLKCNEIRLGDVLVARMPEPTGRCWYVDTLPWPSITAVDVAIVRTNPALLDPLYCSYFLNSPQTLAEVGALTVGTTRVRIKRTDLASLQIKLPPLPIQKDIAGHLRILDDRIKLLCETNATLEAIIHALFKSWFIDFDPVRAKIEGRLPEGMDEDAAGLFPNSFESTELGVVPRGWRRGTFSDIANFQNGYAFKSRDWTDTGHPVVKIGDVKPGIVDLSGCSYVTEQTVVGLDRFRLKRGDLLVGMTGYVGETGLVPAVEPEAYLNQRVGRITTKSGLSDLGYAYCISRSKAFKEFAKAQSHGSAQANVSGGSLMAFPVIVPHATTMEHFNSLIASLLETILKNHEQSQTLFNLHEAMLSRLVSGALKLHDKPPSLEDISV